MGVEGLEEAEGEAWEGEVVEELELEVDGKGT